MFNIGDYIVYGHNGICRVLDITHPDISGIDTDRLYYVLMPEKTKGSRLFCPADDDNISIRRVISADEAKEILSQTKDIEPLEISNDRMRDASYKLAIKSSDLRQWIQVLKTLLIRKKEREELGKKITATDERYLKIAEDALYSELALATGREVCEIQEIILSNCA
ncbi:MAG: CarD family transcriptional regulator [Lachnospiraceae bacterium]|nr:CarD family transcriptional regulator [Lachnospiraceae bacterium]